MKYKPYKKDFSYSYTLGTSPTIGLLAYQPQHVQEVLFSSKAQGEGIEKVRALLKKHNIPSRIDDKQIEVLSKSENTYVIGIFEKYQTQLIPEENHVILVNPSDTGNLGTIIRTMSGFATNNLAIVTPAVDIYDPRVIRASMGEVFHTNVMYFQTFENYQKVFSRTCYAFMLTGSKLLQSITFTPPYTLVFGPEGAGLDESFAKSCIPVRIEQTDVIDSLNLSIAVGIGLYATFTEHS